MLFDSLRLPGTQIQVIIAFICSGKVRKNENRARRVYKSGRAV
jgi:hypothetical protein